ncbi:NADH-ubiquinone oxidoreductase chain 4 [Golovinomyces cichoracearum]|uniref:ATP synthase subunit a n=1 Tax=Golovinomyces cichoracearum TaxID=62708 RepID=A0A420I763_9PEZI|nr:NADH-ubiquinone oxidoreductase chain 4 [Golovinomyces cichoracearum]
MSSIMGTTDFDALSKANFNHITQLFLFYAHVESPLSGSIILAGIVLKLSLYGIFRLILPLLPKASFNCTYIIYVIGVITIIYASFSTLRTIDIKELIAYSSVSHAAVYLIGAFSNTIQGIEGAIVLGLAHGFVSPGLFICAGGILYDRSSTRLITYYRGNSGTPLTLNFIGEFMSLYGAFERMPILGLLASTSIVLSAAYTIFMYNRIAFGGSYSPYFIENIGDVTRREFILLLVFVIFTVLFVNNLIGLVPYSFASTSHFILTFSISFTIVLGATILGFQRHGLKFFSLFVPSGCPLALLPLLVLIEFISYLSRNVSLGLRLAANILSGHMLLSILSGFTYNIMTSGIIFFVLGLIPLAFIIAFSGLELAIAFIQAQVFVVLACSYIKDGLDLH